MDLTLLVVGLGLIIIGFVVATVGNWLGARERAGVTGVQPALAEIIITVLGELVSAIRKVLDGPRFSDRIQGLGAALVWLGLALVVLFVLLAMGGAVGDETGAAPTP